MREFLNVIIKKLFLFCRLHGKDNVAIKRYVISFWNGIDLRYKLLKDPGVKISIAGIIISRVSIFGPKKGSQQSFLRMLWVLKVCLELEMGLILDLDLKENH